MDCVCAEVKIFRRVRAKEVSGGLEAVPPPCWKIAAARRVSRLVQSTVVVTWSMSRHIAG